LTGKARKRIREGVGRAVKSPGRKTLGVGGQDPRKERTDLLNRKRGRGKRDRTQAEVTKRR